MAVSGWSAGTADRRDVLLASICMIVGSAVSVLVFRGRGGVHFYQTYMPDLVYSACGFGLVHPAELPKAVSEFLAVKSILLDCAELGVPVGLQPTGLFTQVHFYLALAVSSLWRMSSIRYVNLWPLVAALAGAYAAACFVLLRLFFGWLAACAGGLVLALSPVSLSMVPLLRDYSKGPFILWGVALLVLARRARSRRALFILSSLAGATIGIGYGFRTDPIVLLPIGIIFLVVGLEIGTWKTRAVAILLFVASMLVIASPILLQQKQSGFGTVFLQGLSEPFRVDLDLGAAPYALGQRYSDELALSSVAADLRPADPEWDAHEGRATESISQAVTKSNGYVAGWIGLFSADVATQALKSAAWIVGFPALAAPGRRGLDPGAWAAASSPLSRSYGFMARSWMPILCSVGLVALFWRISAASAREAAAVFVMFAALLSSSVVQFSVRHVFYLEFFWIAALLALPYLLIDRVGLRRVALPFGAVLATGLCAVVAVRAGLALYQDRALGREFTELLNQPREPVEAVVSQTDTASISTVPLPDRHRALVEGPPDDMVNFVSVGAHWDVRAAADRLLLSIGGPGCPPGQFNLSFRYAKREGVWQPFDHVIAVEAPAEGSSRALVLVPAFYRPSQYFSAIEVPREHSACLAGIERIVGPTRLPVILSAVLAPGWQDRSLHRGFGGFPLKP